MSSTQEIKLCSKCKEKIRLKYSSYCRRCHCDRQKTYYNENKKSIYRCVKIRRDERDAIIREIKSVPCADCGVSYPHYVMDFDHCRGEKDFGIAIKGRLFSIENLMKEISKCDIVCSNCHRERTQKRLLASSVTVSTTDSESVSAS